MKTKPAKKKFTPIHLIPQDVSDQFILRVSMVSGVFEGKEYTVDYAMNGDLIIALGNLHVALSLRTMLEQVLPQLHEAQFPPQRPKAQRRVTRQEKT